MTCFLSSLGYHTWGNTCGFSATLCRFSPIPADFLQHSADFLQYLQIFCNTHRIFCNNCRSLQHSAEFLQSQLQFVAKSDRAEYICCSNWVWGYFCSLDKLASYKRVVQLHVACAIRGGDALLCQYQRTCALRVSCSDKNVGHPYFTCRECWSCTFFFAGLIWKRPFARFSARRPSEEVVLPFFRTEPACYENSVFFLIKKLLCGVFLQ